MFGGVGGGGGGGYMMPAGGYWIQGKLDQTVFNQLSRKMAMLGTEMKILGRDFMIAGGLIAAPMLLAAKEASRATVIQRAFNAVFRGSTQEANRFVQAMASSTGRFTVDLQESLMSIQALFKGMNFGDRSSGLAQFTQGLMTDLAAFRGLSDQDVMSRFVSTLSGSVEAMDQLGIDVHEHAIQQELLAMGIHKSVQEASEQDKIMARLNVIFKAMTQQGAVGAATRALNEFDGQIIQLNTSVKELQASLGNALKPLLEDLLPQIRGVVNEVSKWVEQNPGLVQGLGEVTTALVVMGGAIWTLGAAWRVLAFGMLAMNPWAVAIMATAGSIGYLGYQAFTAGERIGEMNEEISTFLDNSNRRAEWDSLDVLRNKIAELNYELTALGFEKGVQELFNIGGANEANLAQIQREIDAANATLTLVTTQLENAEKNILESPMISGIMSGMTAMSAEVGQTLEDDIASGVQKGFMRGIEGTFSSLSQRMFASQFAESVGTEIATGGSSTRRGLGAAGNTGFRSVDDLEQALQGGPLPGQSISGVGTGMGGAFGGFGRVNSELEIINRRRAARGIRPLTEAEFNRAPESESEAVTGEPDGGVGGIQGGPTWDVNPFTLEPGLPSGEPSHPLLNPPTGDWEMYGKEGANRFGRFIPYNQGPYFNYDGNTPQGSTTYPTAPSPADMPGLGLSGGGTGLDTESRLNLDSMTRNQIEEASRLLTEEMSRLREVMVESLTEILMQRDRPNTTQRFE